MTARRRYSYRAYDGGPDPLAPPFDLGDRRAASAELGDGADDVAAFANKLERGRSRDDGGETSISGAMMYSAGKVAMTVSKLASAKGSSVPEPTAQRSKPCSRQWRIEPRSMSSAARQESSTISDTPSSSRCASRSSSV